jgi:hypothetical protein
MTHLALLVALAFAATASADQPAPPRPKSLWAEVITITKPRGELEGFEAVLVELEREGLDAGTTARLLLRLTTFVDSEVTQHGSAIINIGMLVDALQAVEVAKWSEDDSARFIIALQNELNSEHRDIQPRLLAAIAKVRQGSHVEQLVDEHRMLKAK